MSILKTLCAASALLLLTPVAHANLLINGGFEEGSFTNPFIVIGIGNSGLAGWTVDSGSVDLIGSYWSPFEGNHSLDLNGNEAGHISQSFDTVAGRTYNVSFSMAGNTDAGGSTKWITAGVVGSIPYSFNTTGLNSTNMGWEPRNFSFVAQGTSSTLFFQGDARNTYYGAALDNVSVTAVPEPESAAMLLAGLGLMGAIVWRRKGQPD